VGPNYPRGVTPADLPPPAELLAAAVEALGGTPREGQRQMVEAVSEAIEARRHLLVQAGTGTGKSLGYLVPLVRHALRTDTPVVVSTATLALQAQVVDRDLPRLADAVAPLVGRRPTFQIVKGRANYVCRHKLVGGFPPDEALFDGAGWGGPDSRTGREVVRLRTWAESTRSGDRDELVPGVGERAWRQVSVTAAECLGAQRCPLASECFSEKARARARDVDVVVTNHALLAIDAAEGRQLLPDHHVVVVDEAHELADRVTSVASDVLTGSVVAAAAASARRHGGVDAARLEVAGQDLEAVLEPLAEGRLAAGLPESLQAAVASVRDAARDVLSRFQDAVPDRAQGAHQVARAAMSEVFDVAERFATLDERDVAWLEVRDDGGAPTRRALHVAPLSVAALLRDTLFGDRTVVLTSATLALGGAFDATADSVGLRGEEAPPWEGIDVGSPFDYPRQAMLYVARHLPPPGRDGIGGAVFDELADLVEAAGGRTLGLFSSRRAAEAAAAAMRERLDVPVLCQGEDATPTLVRELAADARTCLFGTLSLWQGVDVPGPACQLVVIDRIPFPRPDDPLQSARAEAVTRGGGNGFMSVSATHAALRLAQGAGRLVRSAGDRGVVAVLDSRLATARYAGFLLRSLPPMWRTTNREVVLGALRRLDASAGDPWPLAPPQARVLTGG
jgi:ATP-dependent DNA helicase DinG